MPQNFNEQLNIADNTVGNKDQDSKSTRPQIEITPDSPELVETTQQLDKLYTDIASDKAISSETLKKIREQVLALQSKATEFPSSIAEQMKTAEKILGKDMLGPDAIEATFGFKPGAKDVPAIPFNETELERAKELNQFLVLRVDKAKDGEPLTMQKMNELKQGKTKDGGKVLFDNDKKGQLESDAWYKDEDFFTKEAPTLGWSLVSKRGIPNSINQNYLTQTKTLANYLQSEVFKGQPLSKVYQDAINEFNTEKDNIETLMASNLHAAAVKLEQLKINNLCRQTPAEALYDILLAKEQNNERYIWPSTWTNRRYSFGRLVCVGCVTGAFAVNVEGCQPDKHDQMMGVSFSRSR